LAKNKPIVTNTKTGLKNKNPTSASTKSITGLIKFLYISKTDFKHFVTNLHTPPKELSKPQTAHTYFLSFCGCFLSI